jgi:hypothetical protein
LQQTAGADPAWWVLDQSSARDARPDLDVVALRREMEARTLKQAKAA